MTVTEIGVEHARNRILTRLSEEALARSRHPGAREHDALDIYMGVTRARHHRFAVAAFALDMPSTVNVEISLHWPVRAGCEACIDIPMWPCPTLVRLALSDPLRYDLGEGRHIGQDMSEETS